MRREAECGLKESVGCGYSCNLVMKKMKTINVGIGFQAPICI